jgi:hypothetical protein
MKRETPRQVSENQTEQMFSRMSLSKVKRGMKLRRTCQPRFQRELLIVRQVTCLCDGSRRSRYFVFHVYNNKLASIGIATTKLPSFSESNNSNSSTSTSNIHSGHTGDESINTNTMKSTLQSGIYLVQSVRSLTCLFRLHSAMYTRTHFSRIKLARLFSSFRLFKQRLANIPRTRD